MFLLSRKHIIQWINASASLECKLDFQFLSYVSSTIWCIIKTVGLIFIRFAGIDQLHIPYTCIKIYANGISASSWLCLKNNHYFCMHRLADKPTQWATLFREWFCNIKANRHDICTKLRQRVKIKVSRGSPESVKFHFMKLTMVFKHIFFLNCVRRLKTSVHNGLMPKVNIFFLGNEH